VQVDDFCIDSTEVTSAQYERFVTAKAGDTSGQVAGCTENTSYVPSGSWPVATNELNQPVTFVDWCDATAYCRWAGKRLCGSIGGGPNPFDAFADELRSQWYRVCSSGGRNAYPYGSTFVAGACNGSADQCSATCAFSDVGSYTGCQGSGAYAGVFDLSGNAMEWEDSCTVGADGGLDVCRLRGGSIYALGEAGMACDDDSSDTRLYTAVGIGFRCCR
jgi:formylglycine-generating enzyme required for sulfatase activity